MAGRPTHVVDACAVIAYLKAENGHERFAEILRDERNSPAIHAVNLCEVYYDFLKSDSIEVAEEAWRSASSVLAVVERVDEGFMKRVARWKVGYIVDGYNLGLADAVAAATAEEFACPLVTVDH